MPKRKDDNDIQDITTEELDILREISESMFLKPGQSTKGKMASYPYAVTCGAVTATGILKTHGLKVLSPE